jgi:hypothetical protein
MHILLSEILLGFCVISAAFLSSMILIRAASLLSRAFKSRLDFRDFFFIILLTLVIVASKFLGEYLY